MKSILLASASIVAFAGAAAAEVTFGGNAALGYNDVDVDDDVDGDDNVGFYWDAELALTLSQELDNGITAAATFNVELIDSDGEDDLDTNLNSADYLLSLSSDMAALYYGETEFAAETYWEGIGNMDNDDFSEADGETVLRGEVTYGSVVAGLSYVTTDAGNDGVNLSEIDDATEPDFDLDDDGDSLDQLSVGAKAEFGQFTVGMAYQEESDAAGDLVGNLDADGDAIADEGAYDPADENGDFNPDEIFGVYAGTTFANADVNLAYASNETDDTDSTAVGVSYPFGPVVLGANYAWNSDSRDSYELSVGYSNGPIAIDAFYENDIEDDEYDTATDMGDEEWSIEGSYDAGNGLMFLAGVLGGEERDGDSTDDDDLDYYVASTYDLGGGAELLVSYAEDEDDSEEDEIGDPEYQKGTTVEVSFEF